MPHIFKSYNDPFVLEKSKLDRIAAVIREAMGPSPDIFERYEVHHSDGTVTILESIDKLYQLHNSGKKLITRLEINIASGAIDPKEASRLIEVMFMESSYGSRVFIKVFDPDSRWTSSTFALIEEQVERCLKAGILHRVITPQSLFSLAFTYGFVIVFVLAMAINFGLYANTQLQQLRNNMWLAPADITELNAQISDSTPLTQEQYLAIIKRQLRNLQGVSSSKPFQFSWKHLFVALPIIIVIASFFYLRTCYPAAIFAWGDREEWYDQLLKRRAYVWGTILGSLTLSILANFFVLGIESFYK